VLHLRLEVRRREAAFSSVAHTGHVRRIESVWERPWGWLVPGGLPWKLGRRDGRTGREKSTLTIFLVFGVWSVRIYERGRAMSLAEAP
jgi:hypothetical protein